MIKTEKYAAGNFGIEKIKTLNFMNDIKDCDYKPDFEILDRYINFSSELLRLSLLGISGFGTLLLLKYSKDIKLELNESTKVLLFLSVILWSLSSGFALAHRFFASDSMAYHIAYLRKNEIEQKIGRKKLLKLSK